MGEDLQFTKEGLEKRKRGSVEISLFEEKLKKGLTEIQQTPDKRVEIVTGLIADVRTMITQMGDTSNLILDPDLDSYYLMDVTLLALPQTQDRISEIIAFAESKAGQWKPEDLVQMAVYAALLKQSDMDRIMGDLQTTLNEDVNFYGPSPTLKSDLAPALERYQKSTEAFIAAIQDVATHGQVKDAAVFHDIGMAAMRSSFSAWDVAVKELDVLLEKRVDTLVGQKQWSLFYAMLALLAAVAVLGWIGQSFNSNMKQVIAALQEAVSGTKQAGEDLIHLSDQLSEFSSEQASAVQQTSSAIHEIESMTRNTMSNVATARSTAAESEKSATETQKVVRDLSGAIEEISSGNQMVLGQMETSKKEMSEITSIISEIGTKTKVINEIVFQTKLLSFNASVEAARAGEAGKGFAVVAEEVGNLAQMSGSASKEIADMLQASIHRVQGISQSTNSKVSELVRDGRNRVEDVMKLASESGDAIATIGERINSLLRVFNEILEAAQEQSRGVEHVSNALHQLESIAQKNKQMSQQSAEQSRVIVAQAESLDAVASMVHVAVMGHHGDKDRKVA